MRETYRNYGDELFDRETICNAIDPDMSAESILELVRKFQEQNVPQLPQVFVVTTAIFEELKRQTVENKPENFFGMSGISGIPVECYDTAYECMMRAVELRKEGVRVAVCYEGK